MVFRLSFLFLLLSFSCFAQTEPGVRQIGFGGNAVATRGDVFSCYTNEAILAYHRFPQAGFFYSPAPFGMTEMRTAALALSLPVFDGAASLSVLSYGFELYKLHRVQAGYAYRLKNALSVGASAELTSLTIQRYGDANALQFNAGVIYNILPSLRLGAAIKNVFDASIGEAKSPLPVWYRTAIAYSDREMELTAGIEKEKGFSESVSVGLSYRLSTYFEILAGYSSLAAQMSFGAVINYSNISALYAVSNNQILGYTHQFGVLLSLHDVAKIF